LPGVLWLASYPKSGNTWVRAFLVNYLVDGESPVDINSLPEFGFGDGQKMFYEQVLGRRIEGTLSVEETQRLRLKVHEMFAASSENTAVVKTHNAIAFLGDLPTISPQATAGAIYVVRNPLDVVLSYAHHYGQSIDQAITAMGSIDNHLPAAGDQVFQYIDSWSGHALSWTQAPGMKLHLMRYEDMRREPEPTFSALVRFLEMPLMVDRLRKALEFSSFDSLSRQESERGFIESVPTRVHAAFRPESGLERPSTTRLAGVERVRFFRSGRVGEWRERLSPDQVRRVIEDHRDAMRKFGYLDADDNPVV
jgi:hypothetical protein